MWITFSRGCGGDHMNKDIYIRRVAWECQSVLLYFHYNNNEQRTENEYRKHNGLGSCLRWWLYSRQFLLSVWLAQWLHGILGLRMNTYELRDKAIELAKEKYGDNYLSALWGSASVLLTDKDLKVIVSVMSK